MSGSGISWAICKSASRSRQTTMPVPHNSVFLQAGCPFCRQSTEGTTSITKRKTADRASWLCITGGNCLSSPTRTNRRAWNSGLRLASRETCEASSTMQMSNVRRENNAVLLTPRHVVATTDWTAIHRRSRQNESFTTIHKTRHFNVISVNT